MYPTWRRDHFFEVDGKKHHVALALSFSTQSHETREALQDMSDVFKDLVNDAVTECLTNVAQLITVSQRLAKAEQS